MRSHNLIPAVLLAGLFGLQATVSNAQAIGQTTSVTPQAEGDYGGKRTLQGGTSVYSKETVRTGQTGAAAMRFHDNSNLSVGPKSNVTLDKFVYDPTKSTGSAVIRATRGSFRFISGSQRKGSYTIKTPYGTLGIRG